VRELGRGAQTRKAQSCRLGGLEGLEGHRLAERSLGGLEGLEGCKLVERSLAGSIGNNNSNDNSDTKSIPSLGYKTRHKEEREED
jgi:hypothetical protein